MNSLLVGVCLLVVLGSIPARGETDWVNIDVDAALKDDALVSGFINCVLDGAACEEGALKLKGWLNDAFQTNCEKCTDEQKTKIRKLVVHMKTNRADDWAKVIEMYDPKKEHAESFKAFMEGQ